MDMKPGNFLIDDNDDLVLIDWEQSDAPPTTLAPEADGTWNLEEVDVEDGMKRSRYRFIKYTGPSRSNMSEDLSGGNTWNVWNVFPIWSKSHPRALELAEVFSLGRSMWMVLRQPDMDFDDIEHSNDMIIDWDDAEDNPHRWRTNAMQCMPNDPNERPDLDQLMEHIMQWEARD